MERPDSAPLLPRGLVPEGGIWLNCNTGREMLYEDDKDGDDEGIGEAGQEPHVNKLDVRCRRKGAGDRLN